MPSVRENFEQKLELYRNSHPAVEPMMSRQDLFEIRINKYKSEQQNQTQSFFSPESEPDKLAIPGFTPEAPDVTAIDVAGQEEVAKFREKSTFEQAFHEVPEWMKAGYSQSITGLVHELITGKTPFDLTKYEPNMLEDIASTVFSFVMPLDAATLALGGAPAKLAISTTTKLVTKKLIASGVKREIAEQTVKKASEKFLARTAASAVITGSKLTAYSGAASTAGQAVYEGEVDLTQSVKDALKGGALGLILGATGGATAPLLKFGIPGRAGQLGAEISAFVGGEAAIEQKLPTLDDVARATGIVIGLKFEGIASNAAKRRIAERITEKVVTEKMDVWESMQSVLLELEGKSITLEFPEKIGETKKPDVSRETKPTEKPKIEPEAEPQIAAIKDMKPGELLSEALKLQGEKGFTGVDLIKLHGVDPEYIENIVSGGRVGKELPVKEELSAIIGREKPAEEIAEKPAEKVEVEKEARIVKKTEYPLAKDVVDGRKVRDKTPNQESIGASLDDYKVLDGIREVPMSDFELTGEHYSVQGNKNIANLAKQISESKEINPLIVVKDAEGSYILEGATRADALKRLGAKSFPAKVVIDKTVEKPAPTLPKAKKVPSAEAEAKRIAESEKAKGKIEVAEEKAGVEKEPFEITEKEHAKRIKKMPIEDVKSELIDKLMLRDGFSRQIAEDYIKDADIREMHNAVVPIAIVEKALSEGRPVPDEVLKDYPDLKPTKPVTKPEAELPEVKPVEKAPEIEKTELPESKDIRGLNVEENNRLREKVNLDNLDDFKRKTHKETYQRAKDQNLDESAITTAESVIKNKRMITDEEFAGMVIKSVKLENDYDASVKLQNELIKKGDTKGAELEAETANTIIEQLDILTQGSRFGKREVARSLASGTMRVDPADYSLARATQEGQSRKGKKLSTEEKTQIKEVIKERDFLAEQLKELEDKFEKEQAEREKTLAERITKEETRRAKIGKRIATKKEKILNEQADILKDIANLGYRINDITGISSEGSFLVGKLALNYIKLGTANLSEVVKQVRQKVPDLTERDVYQALNAKDPKRQAKAKSDADKQVILLKRQARILEDIEKINEGIFTAPKKRPPQPKELKKLEKKLRHLRNQAYQSGINPARLEKAINTINALQDQIANQIETVKEKRPLETAELTEAKEKIAELRKTLRIDTEIAKLNEQLRTGDFEIKEKFEPKEYPADIERKMVELNVARKQVRLILNDLAPITARTIFTETVNTLRTMKATADLSGTLRQGIISTVTHPIMAGKAFGKSFKATFHKYTAEQIENGIKSADHHYIREKSKLELTELEGKPTDREEIFMARLIEKVPVIGHVIQGSNRHMTTFLNLMRVGIFDAYLAKNPNATHAELTAWANWINVTTGRGNLGRAKAFANELSLGIFAPKFSMSRIQTPYKVFQYWKLPRVRKAIAKDMAIFGSFGLTALALAKLAGWEVGDNPRDADFGKIKIENTRIDLWGGYQQPTRLIIRLGMAVTDKAGLTGRDLVASEKYIDPLEAVGRFSRYKLAPSVNIPLELLKGKTAVGEPVTPSETAINAIIPMVYEDIFDAYKDAGFGRAAWVGGLVILGIGSSTYPNSERKTRSEMRKMIREGNKEGSEQLRKEWNIQNPDKKIISVMGIRTTERKKINDLYKQGKKKEAENRRRIWNDRYPDFKI